MNENKKEKEPKDQKTEEQRMDYEAFILEMAAKIRQHAGTGTEVNLKDTSGNNGTSRKGIFIQKKGQNTVPIIYLEPYYVHYLEGAEVDELAEAAYTAGINNRHPENLDISVFRDYEKVKERVLFKLVNYKWNEEFLKEVPHRKYLDLAAVCYCPLDKDEIPGLAFVLIRTEHLALWGITEEELLERAFQNTPRLLKPRLLDIEDVIRSLLSDEESEEFPKSKDNAPKMLVLTNRDRVNGAACLLYPGLLKQLAEKEKTDFVILPSSVNEVLLVPVTGSVEKDKISVYTQMVQEVNQTQLAEEEILSDHVYIYDRSKAEVCTDWPEDISEVV